MNSTFDVDIDIQLSLTKVARLIEENSRLRVETVSKLGEGLEFQSFLVNGAWVFRFPKHFSEAHDPFTERMFSERLKLSTTVPEINFIWSHPWGYPETVSGYKYLPGKALENFCLEETDQDDLANQLGTVLTELHSMDGNGTTSSEDQLATMRTWSEDLEEQLSNLANNPISSSQQLAVTAYVEQYRFDLPPSENVPIHGDLGADHILINAQRQLTGIIDWSNHANGNRYRDFVGIWRWGGDAFCASVFSNYLISPSVPELAFVRVMGLISCISREILVSSQPDRRLHERTRSLLKQRVSEIASRCPYEPLSD